jgi:hypothetical protein
MYSLILWRKCSPLLFIVMVLLLAVPGVTALNDTAPLTVTPASLTITGDTSGVVTRTLVLQAGEDISDLTFKPLDLQDPDTGQTYPATMVSTSTTSRSTTVPEALQNATISDLFFYLMKHYAEAGPLYPVYLLNPSLLLSTQTFTLQGMQAGGSEDVTLQFVLEGAEPGRFSGEYLFTYQDGGTTRLPVTMTLRKGPWIPAILLAVTVLISFAIFKYAELLKQRDEISWNLLVIQSDIEKSEDLNKPERENWGFPNPFKTSILQLIGEANRVLAMNDVKMATQYQNAAIELWHQWNLNRPAWVRILGYAKDLYAARMQRDRGILLAVIESLPSLKGPEEGKAALDKFAEDHRVLTQNAVPGVKEPESPDGIINFIGTGYMARMHLQIYQFASLSVTAFILFLFGLSELYYSNPTFGASASDYITLILWGLFVGPVSGAIAGKASAKVGIP